jgi:hypothetical protein
MIVIVYRGWGLLLFPLIFAGIAVIAGGQKLRLILGEPLAELITGLGVAVDGCAIWWIGRRLARTSTRHSLFFVKFEYWSFPVLMVAAILIYVMVKRWLGFGPALY